MIVEIVKGDILDQQVEVIVNAWNRNIIPWWLLIPQGVSGAIKKRGGYQPFRELARLGPIPVGTAVVTGAGRLPFKAIIHVAGINMLWFSSEKIVRKCVASALTLATEKDFRSIAMPLIGAGTGGLSSDKVLHIMRDEAVSHPYPGKRLLVVYEKSR